MHEDGPVLVAGFELVTCSDSKLQKRDESWIYAYDRETKQQSTLWMSHDEPNPTKLIRSESTLKQTVACFFSINGHMVTAPLENRKTVNSEWYTTICFSKRSLKKKGKNSDYAESIFITMLAVTRRLKLDF
ncbi:hypothetical protein EVAR_40101_1 [Eumeta japonica]|uniref:Uncharacterized protein n=1 Tax=Eumeta variegata TaxID=151549 RepID=A0A4C1WBM7_EUMVA|nr:hypothetical protein EVAR_40101_1 [Eumeta japonica]